MTDEQLLQLLNKNIEALTSDVKDLSVQLNEIKQNSNCLQNTKRIHTLWDDNNLQKGRNKAQDSWVSQFKAPIITGVLISIMHWGIFLLVSKGGF